MNNLNLELQTAAFAKMAQGEPVSLADAQRVWEVVLNHGRNVDTGNQEQLGQFLSQLKATLNRIFFS
jgi:hypothetical protein